MKTKQEPTSREHESGFTLIELLVVILIIGVLTAIAVPLFLNQRQQANESALRSDLRNIAITVENHFIKEPNDKNVSFDDIDFKASKGVTFAIRGNANTWCAVAGHKDTEYSDSLIGVTKALTYDSTAGGIMPPGWDWRTQSKCETPETGWSWLYG